MPDYYIQRSSGRIVGPLSGRQLAKMALEGELLPTEGVSKDPEGPFRQASRFPALQFQRPAPGSDQAEDGEQRPDLEERSWASGPADSGADQPATDSAATMPGTGPGHPESVDSIGAQPTIERSPKMVQVIVLSGIGLFLGIGCVVPYAMLGQWRKLLLNQVVLIALVFLLLPPCCCICIPVPIAIVGTLALNGLALVDGLLIVKARESGTAYPVYGYAVRPLWHIMRFIDRRAVHVPVSLPR